MTGVGLAVAVLAAVLTVALLRECERVERERQLREWLASNPPELQRMVRAFEDAAEHIGRTMLPALRSFGKAVAQIDWTPLRDAARQVDVTIHADTSNYEAGLARAREATKRMPR